jgi:Cu(I)/Ag(I) efflux system membrane fusion protein
MKTNRFSIVLVAAVGAVAFAAGAVSSRRGGVDAAAVAGRVVTAYACPMHPGVVSGEPGDCPACGMALARAERDAGTVANLPSARPAGSGAIVVDETRRQELGVRVSPVEVAAQEHTFRAVGRVVADETRTATINAGADGYVRDVSGATTGSRVRKGQVLATVSVPEAIPAVQSYLVALGAMDRLEESGEQGSAQAISTGANFQQRVEKLLDLGMSIQQLEEIRRTRDAPKEIRILAPVEGLVLARSLSTAQRFSRGAAFFQVADLRRVWVLADLGGLDASHVRAGMRAVVTEGRARSFDARVGDVVPQFDSSTRTVNVRVEVENPDYLLRPGMLVEVDLPVALPRAITVAADAVIDSGLRQSVFIEREAGAFELRQVRVGWRLGGRVEIQEGLTPGDRVVTSGTFLLDSESRMRLAGAPGGRLANLFPDR